MNKQNDRQTKKERETETEKQTDRDRDRHRDRRTDRDLIDLFIERMTILGSGLVFQPVLVTHTCTYSKNNIITLQNIDITDFPSNNNNNNNKIK